MATVRYKDDPYKNLNTTNTTLALTNDPNKNKQTTNLTPQQIEANRAFKAGEIDAETYKQQYMTPKPVFKETVNPVEQALKNQVQPVQQIAPQPQMLSAQAPTPPPIQDYSGQISQQYGAATQAMVDKIRNAIAQSKIEQQGIIQKAPQQFDPLRGQSELAKGQQLRSVLERNSLLGDRGGVGRSAALQTQTAGENRLNDINLQQQNVIDTANQKIASLEAQGRFEEANVVASQKLAELQALMQESQRRDELARQNEQLMYNRTQDAQNIARQETAQTQEQERADFQTKILANYQNISAFVNQLVAQGAPQWQIDQANAARIQKIIENNLDPNTGKPMAQAPQVAQLTPSVAMELWQTLGTSTPAIAQALGVPEGQRYPAPTYSGSTGGSSGLSQAQAIARWKATGFADPVVAAYFNVPLNSKYGEVTPQQTQSPMTITQPNTNLAPLTVNDVLGKLNSTDKRTLANQWVSWAARGQLANLTDADFDAIANKLSKLGISEQDFFNYVDEVTAKNLIR